MLLIIPRPGMTQFLLPMRKDDRDRKAWFTACWVLSTEKSSIDPIETGGIILASVLNIGLMGLVQIIIFQDFSLIGMASFTIFVGASPGSIQYSTLSVLLFGILCFLNHLDQSELVVPMIT
jgi:hypothetical protein